MTSTRIVIAGAAVALLAPASARAAELQTQFPCYLERQPMAVAGTGWGPGSAWSVQADQIFAQGTADPAGNFVDETQITAPIVPEITTKPTTVTLTGLQDGQPVAETTFQVVNFLVDAKGSAFGKPTKKTTFTFSGFQPGKALYVHVKKKGSSKVYTQRIGKAATPCGTFRKKLRRLPAVPANRIQFGKYVIAFDNRKNYVREAGQYELGITIYKKFV